ncbi:D-alanyl-D-alanine carboxypeptidase [Cognatishimia sp. SS12]|uniref:D-alanyl-D-alanine carboxypeptidase/D-alanyl-D-alanine-endopeptidase n=1 Tax=Cognatishimia sp. SS12 TaxID=2979465 RepID=UPI00232EE6B5|nr:D-alanyl-D-alanine carboxypeptidase [Cognatishimia sp. SS12]MDC0738881.1 D-alanyl-D-alanine carboxypeptidase [Cognatishimia sp. SS12]
MSSRISRRSLLAALGGALGASIAAPLWAGPPSRSLRPVPRPGSVPAPAPTLAADLVAGARLNGDVGFAVVRVGTGEVLEQFGTDVTLPPASVVKAVTALYALDRLGEAHRFETRVLATGPVDETGELQGDLVLVGGGDPTLDTDDLAKLAKAVAESGVQRITGRFLVYGGALPFVRAIDPDQPKHVGYSTAISGLSLNFNRIYFDWKKTAEGYDIGMDGRSGNLRPPVTMADMQLSDRAAPVYDYRDDPSRDLWSVAQSALGKEGGRWLPTRHPELYAGDVFAWLMRAEGVALPLVQKTTSLPKGRALATHRSAQLVDILRDMLKYSTNLTAEMVGLAASQSFGIPVASLRGSGAQMGDWATAALGMRQAKFADHSGLSDRSRLQATELALALAMIERKAMLHPILKPFVMRDANGKPSKSHPIKVDAKTGTLNFVSGLGGYLRAPDGAELAFAIFSADFATRDALSRAERERPPGSKSWASRARKLQRDLIERWGASYGS